VITAEAELGRAGRAAGHAAPAPRFGHVVIGDERSLNGKVAIEFAAEGLNWSVSIPATNLVSETQAGD
jgi:hypothetical protein